MARGGNGKEFAEAVAAYESAVKPFDQKLYPVEWAAIQYDIATNLANLGIHEIDSQHLRDAVAILNDVLLVRTRGRMPHESAMTQVALGEAFEQLGEREPGSSYFADAVTAEKSALEVLQPNNDPSAWALAQSDLGVALSGVALRDDSIDEFEQAIAAMRAGATDEFRQRDPISWLRVQGVLVMNLEQLDQLEWRQESVDENNSNALDSSAQEHLEEAVATARASLEEASKDGPRST
jgi:tetratricopeptide (TPR) repeat protein